MTSANATSSGFGFNEVEATKRTSVVFVTCQRRRPRYNDGEIIKDDHWHGTRYTGTVKGLLRVGLIEEHMLPGRPGRNKTSVTLSPSSWGMGFIDRIRIEKRTENIYAVYAPVRKEEAERRWKTRMAENEAEIQKEQADKFKANAISSLRTALRWARGQLITEDGYRFDDETLCDFEQVADELMNALKDGQILKSYQAVVTAPLATKSSHPQSDLQLQRFLRSVTSDSSLVQDEKREGV